MSFLRAKFVPYTSPTNLVPYKNALLARGTDRVLCGRNYSSRYVARVMRRELVPDTSRGEVCCVCGWTDL